MDENRGGENVLFMSFPAESKGSPRRINSNVGCKGDPSSIDRTDNFEDIRLLESTRENIRMTQARVLSSQGSTLHNAGQLQRTRHASATPAFSKLVRM